MKIASYRKLKDFGCEYEKERANSGLSIQQIELVPIAPSKAGTPK